MTITKNERKRLAEIRADLEKHRALGVDVSCWHDEFFLKLIDKMNKQKRKRGN